MSASGEKATTGRNPYLNPDAYLASKGYNQNVNQTQVRQAQEAPYPDAIGRRPGNAAPGTSPSSFGTLSDALNASKGYQFSVIQTSSGPVYAEYGQAVAYSKYQADYQAAEFALQQKAASGEAGVYVQGQFFPNVSAAEAFLQTKYPGYTITPKYDVFYSGHAIFFKGFTITPPASAQAAQNAVDTSPVFSENYLPAWTGAVGTFLTGIYRTPQLAVLAGERLTRQSETGSLRGTPAGFGTFLVGEVGAFSGGFLSFINPNALKISSPEITVAEGAGVVAQLVTGGYAIKGFEEATGIATLSKAGVLGKTALIGTRFVEGGAIGAGEAYLGGYDPYRGFVTGGLLFAGGSILVEGGLGVARAVGGRVVAPIRGYFVERAALGEYRQFAFFPQFDEATAVQLEAIRAGSPYSRLPDEFRFIKDLQENPTAPEIIRRFPGPPTSGLGLGGFVPPEEGGMDVITPRERAAFASLKANAADLNAEAEVRRATEAANEIRNVQATGEVTQLEQRVEFKPLEEYKVEETTGTTSLDAAIAESRASAEAAIRGARRYQYAPYEEITFLTVPPGTTRPFAIGGTSLGLGTSRVSTPAIRDITALGLDTSLLPGLLTVQELGLGQRTQQRTEQVTAQVTEVNLKAVTDTVLVQDVAFQYEVLEIPAFAEVGRGLFDFPIERYTRPKRRKGRTRYTEFVRPHQLSENILTEPSIARIGALIFG